MRKRPTERWVHSANDREARSASSTDNEFERRPERPKKQKLSSGSTSEGHLSPWLDLPAEAVQARPPDAERDESELSDLKSDMDLVEETEDHNGARALRSHGETPDIEISESELSDIESEIFHAQDPTPTVNMSVIHGTSDTLPKTVNALPEFPYRRLNPGFMEIRVVTLMPGPKDAPIVCQIDHVRADRTSDDVEKEYNALSYTWGSPDATRKLILQGISVQVRENLWQVSRAYLAWSSRLHAVLQPLEVVPRCGQTTRH